MDPLHAAQNPCRHEDMCRSFHPMSGDPSVCACRHAVDDHGPALPAKHCRVGGHFISAAGPNSVNPRTTCIRAGCGAEWWAHLDPHSAPLSQYPGAQVGSFSQENGASTAQGVAVVAWQSPPGPVPGSVNDRRVAPHHTSSSRPSGVAAPPFTAQSFPTASPQQNVGSSFLSPPQPTVSGGRRASASTRPKPEHRFIVVIHPEPNPDRVPTESGRAFSTLRGVMRPGLHQFLQSAERAKLAFRVQFQASPMDKVYSHFDEGLRRHMQDNSLAWAASPFHSASTPHLPDDDSPPWAFLEPPMGAKSKASPNPVLSYPRQSPTSLTLQKLSKMCVRWDSPSHRDYLDYHVVYIAPDELVMVGPRLAVQGPRHFCLGFCLWEGFIDSFEGPVQCLRSCRSAQTSSVGTALAQFASASPAALPFISPSSSIASSSSSSTRQLDLLVAHGAEDGLSEHLAAAVSAQRAAESAAAWRTNISSQMPLECAQPLYIDSPNVQDAALAFLHALKVMCGSSNPSPSGLATTEISGVTPESLMCLDRTLNTGIGVGQGPMRAFWSQVIKFMTESGHWVKTVDGYMTLAITSLPLSDDDLAALQSYGVILRLGLCWGQALLPVSPFLLATLLGGYSLAVGGRLVHELAPRAASRLAKWPPPTVGGVLSLQHGVDPMALINEVEENLTIEQARVLSQPAQDELAERIKCNLLFNSLLARDCAPPQAFQVMREGLDWAFDDGTTLAQTFNSGLSGVELPLVIQGLFQGARLVCYSQIIPLIEYTVGTPGARDADCDFAGTRAKWETQFRRFIQGVRNPITPGDEAVSDPAHRARLLIKAVAEWEYLPTTSDEKDKIQFKFVSKLTAPPEQAWAALCGFVIHTCYQTLDILLDARIAGVLADSEAMLALPENQANADHVDTPFDLYMFQILGPTGPGQDYNMV
ncbi:hypothetical protein FA95DRAFT_1565736 [Auriscalpium vulgare]|uniref:Uncharacterized protein n=1 Tax=Auriscalpium vulgare TaxID=40419 RepID=A0ACB8RBZ4_9AGAM|nr:hypothetical protein FA95DRAFT_1565736 [Auriscalpium vulgare]